MITSPGTSYQTRAYVLFHSPSIGGEGHGEHSTLLAHQAAPKKNMVINKNIMSLLKDPQKNLFTRYIYLVTK